MSYAFVETNLINPADCDYTVFTQFPEKSSSDVHDINLDSILYLQLLARFVIVF